jgi:hypothetical protein
MDVYITYDLLVSALDAEIIACGRWVCRSWAEEEKFPIRSRSPR